MLKKRETVLSFYIFIFSTIGIILAGLLAYAFGQTGIQEKSINLIKKFAIVSILLGLIGGIATANDNRKLTTSDQKVNNVPTTDIVK
jgi:type III secretory pathway component EscS